MIPLLTVATNVSRSVWEERMEIVEDRAEVRVSHWERGLRRVLEAVWAAERRVRVDLIVLIVV